MRQYLQFMLDHGVSRGEDTSHDAHAPGVAAWAGGCAEAINKKRTTFFEPNDWLEEDGVFLLFQKRFSDDADAGENFHDGQTHEDT